MNNYKYSNNNRKGFFHLLKTKIFILVLLSLIFFSGYHFYTVKQKQNKINQEVKELEDQISEFEKNNQNLEQLSQYLQTDDFKEKEAKENLDLIKEGEKVVIVKKSQIKKTIEKPVNEKPEIEVKRPNYYYWWHYFFGIKPETSSASSFEKN